AVTKGLNPDVPMKDSGVEWLGEVPEHWRVMPLKYICALIKDGTHLPPPRVDNGIPLLSVRNIVGGVFQFRDDDSQISHKDYKSLCSSFVPKKDDVLLAIVGATLGKVALVPEMDSFHIQRSLGVFRTTKLIHPQHLSYVFESKDFQSLLWENAGFSAQPGIYLGTLSNFCVPVPPVTEQFKISEFITATVSKLDLLISQASQLITLIQERRTALISAAVTGKIDVRDWVAPDMQDVEEPQETTA
ncbi:TPA: restriction endonuclease subunit S, partial [Serratia marcescens]